MSEKHRPSTDADVQELAGRLFDVADATSGDVEGVDALVGAGADALAGHPPALDAARMFEREDYPRVLGKHPE
ncbi:hypothetical protein [Rhodococcus xishaensis]|uniref:hypothetical protein n=1 Tax=Rhodococcus xishaensis TaxID=2487364 RepID=UPI001F2DAF6E|nr:hypothetical protein [Rhodococcus xishaensis]